MSGMSNAPLAPWQQRMYERAVEALDSGRMGHALLLSGPERLGKRAVAERLAQYVLCTAQGARPCGRCRSCELYAARSQRDPLENRPDGSLAHPDGHPMHPDAVFIGYAWKMTSPPRQLTQVSVDQVRALSERLGITPGSAGFNRLKRGFVPTYDRWSRPIYIDGDMRDEYPGRKLMPDAPQSRDGKPGHQDG